MLRSASLTSYLQLNTVLSFCSSLCYCENGAGPKTASMLELKHVVESFHTVVSFALVNSASV